MSLLRLQQQGRANQITKHLVDPALVLGFGQHVGGHPDAHDFGGDCGADQLAAKTEHITVTVRACQAGTERILTGKFGRGISALKQFPQY